MLNTRVKLLSWELVNQSMLSLIVIIYYIYYCIYNYIYYTYKYIVKLISYVWLLNQASHPISDRKAVGVILTSDVF